MKQQARGSAPLDILDDPFAAFLPPFPPTGARGRRSAPPSTTNTNSNTAAASASPNAADSTAAAGPAAMMPAPVPLPASGVVAMAGGPGGTVEHLGGMMLPGLGVNVYVLRCVFMVWFCVRGLTLEYDYCARHRHSLISYAVQ